MLSELESNIIIRLFYKIQAKISKMKVHSHQNVVEYQGGLRV